MLSNKEMEEINKQVENIKKSIPEVSAVLELINKGVFTDLKKSITALRDFLSDSKADLKVLSKNFSSKELEIFYKEVEKKRKESSLDLDKISKAAKTFLKDLAEGSKKGSKSADSFKDMADSLDNITTSYDEIKESLKQTTDLLKRAGTLQDTMMESVAKMASKKIDLFSESYMDFSGLDKAQDIVESVTENVGKKSISMYIDGKMKAVDTQEALEMAKKNIEQGLQEIDIQLSLSDGVFKGLDVASLSDVFIQAISQASDGLTVDIGGVNLNIKDDINEITNAIQKQTQGFISLVDEYNKTEKLDRQRLKGITDAVGMTEEEGLVLVENLKRKMLLLDTTKKALLAEKDTVEVLKKAGTVYIGIRSAAEGVASFFDGLSSGMPPFLSSLLGIENTADAIRESGEEAAKAFARGLKDGKGHAESMADALKSFAPSLRNAVSGSTLLLGVFAALFSLSKSISEKYDELSQKNKISAQQAKVLYKTNLDTLTAYENQISSLESLEEAQTQMIAHTGSVSEAISASGQQTALAIAQMGEAFGYGSEMSAKLHYRIKALGADDAFALKLQEGLGYMSEMEGLAPNIIANDVIEAAEEMSLYFSGMPEKALQAAINIRKMGFSLKQAGGIAKNMMDLEGFMTDMYELVSMTDGGIDLSKAFEFGLRGELENMTDAILDQIGTVEKLNQMDGKQKLKFANTLKISVSELEDAITAKEALSKFDDKTASDMKNYLDDMGSLKGLNSDMITERYLEAKATKGLEIQWQKIKAILIKTILPAVESFTELLGSSIPTVSAIVSVLGSIFNVLELIISPLIKGFLMPFKFILDVTGKVLKTLLQFVGILDESGNEIKDASASAEIFRSVLQNIGVVLGSMYISWKLVLNPLLKYRGIIEDSTSMLDKSKTAGKSLFSILKGIPKLNLFGGIKNLTQTVVDAVKNIKLDKVSIDTPTVDAAAAKPKGFDWKKILQPDQYKQVWKVVKGSSKGIFEKLKTINWKGIVNPDSFKNLWSSIKNIDYNIFNKIKSVDWKKILQADTYKKIWESIKGGAGSLFESVKTGSWKDKIFKPKTAEGEAEAEKVSKKAKKEKVDDSPAKDGMSIFENVKKGFQTGFNVIQSAVKTVTSVIKNVIKDLLSVVTNTLKELTNGISAAAKNLSAGIRDVLSNLSSGVGTAFKNILKGIGDGLASFKTSALKGAATLLVLSAALWIVSKSVQNFADVGWEGFAMGMASLAGLAVVAKILGSATSSLLKGAIALALIGLSLIPAAAAFQMFSGVSWDSLALAGVAIIGLSAAVAILGAIMLSGGGAAAILLGAVALAAIGASLIPAAAAMLIFSIAAEKLSSAMDEISEGLSTIIKAIGDSISKVIQTISSGVTQIIDSIQNLSNINGANLLLVAAGITAVGAALLSFSALSSIGSVMSSITSLFSEDPVEKLQRIADMGDDLYNSAQSIKSLSGVIANLQILNTIDGGNLIVAAAGITAFSVALLSFSALSGISSIMSSVMSIFSGDPIDNLERIANMSDGLTKSAMAVATLSSALTALAAALESITTDRIDRLKDINNVGNFIKPIIQSSVQENKKFVEYSDNEEKENFGNYQSPIKDVTKPFISMAKATVPFVATAKPMIPPAETTAQNISIKDNKSISESSVKSNTGDLIQPYMEKKTGTLDTSRMESLLKQLIDVVHAYSNRPQEVIIDRPAVNKLRGLIKAGNNNV